jgi:phage gpG-like protein
MISGSIIGDRELVKKLGVMPARAKAAIDATVQALGFELEAYVKARKLTGQVLKVRTGRLRASISQSSAQRGGDSRSRFVSTENSATAIVGTNVIYGAAWEFGSRAHDIVPLRAKALRFEIGGQVLFRRRVTKPAQAPRPFLRPSLQEMKPHIIERIEATLRRVAVETIKP